MLDLNLQPVILPEAGLVLSEHVANELNVRPGQRLEVEVLEGRRAKLSLPVSQIIQTYLGMAVYMDNAALSEILDESVQVSGAHIAYDGAATEELFEAVKNLPAVSAIALQKTSLARFRETLAQTIYIMTTVYIALSGVIAFGVVYNSARIQLSERSREFASLRVLGFTRNEVSRVMFTELATLVLLAIPLGYLIGYGFASVVVKSLRKRPLSHALCHRAQHLCRRVNRGAHRRGLFCPNGAPPHQPARPRERIEDAGISYEQETDQTPEPPPARPEADQAGFAGRLCAVAGKRLRLRAAAQSHLGRCRRRQRGRA